MTKLVRENSLIRLLGAGDETNMQADAKDLTDRRPRDGAVASWKFVAI